MVVDGGRHPLDVWCCWLGRVDGWMDGRMADGRWTRGVRFMVIWLNAALMAPAINLMNYTHSSHRDMGPPFRLSLPSRIRVVVHLSTSPSSGNPPSHRPTDRPTVCLAWIEVKVSLTHFPHPRVGGSDLFSKHKMDIRLRPSRVYFN